MTRDGAETIGETLGSIVSQSQPPAFIVVVDDGSTDGTPEVLKGTAKTFPDLHVVKTSSTTRDIRRVPVLLNLGIARALGESRGSSMPRYMMVSGDDNWLAPDYASTIMDRMDADPGLAVASGSWLGGAGRSGQMPHGGGRFVRSEFMESLGGRYPVAYGWETWILYKAMQAGLRVRNFGDVRYRHLRPYAPRNLFGWGRAMFSLGFPSVFVFLRFGLNFVWSRRGTQTRRASVTMLAGYMSAKLNPGPLRPNLIKDESLKAFVRRFSMARLTRAPW
ncbi:MAG TPA: glycosyltransferase family A protein [Nitrososphaerales archaeon]|nr:glycosyltransferase family A protein [Nitrososphaerales archaeon]